MRIVKSLALVAALSLLLGLPIPESLAQFSPCQYCWTGSGIVGECDNVLNPNPSIATLSNCRGGTLCFRTADGFELCRAHCFGNQCYWV